MRVLMIGPSHLIAMRRPLNWVLNHGHEVWLVDYQNPLHARPGYRFVPFSVPEVRNFSKFLEAEETKRISWKGALQLRQLAERVQPDVIHVHAIDWRAYCCALAQLKPLVLSVWGSLNYIPAPDVRKVPPDIRRVLEAADLLIVETPHLIAKCQALIKRPLRIELMPLGTNTNTFRPRDSAELAPWRRALKIPKEAIVLLSPRGWAEAYGQHHILEAYAQAYPRFHTPTILLFVKLGRSGPGGASEAERYDQRMRQRIEELALSEVVRSIPALRFEMMPSLYGMADVVINYPSVDAFPSTLIEAAACERPVITSRLPNYRGTFVEAFFTLVEPEQPLALAEAMLEVVNRAPTERAARLSEARQVIIEEYEETIAQERLLTIYNSLA